MSMTNLLNDISEEKLKKAHDAYKRRLELNKKWRDNHREAYNESQRKLMKERYRNNPEVRRNDVNRYYIKKYLIWCIINIFGNCA